MKSWLLRLQQNIIWQQDLVEDTFIFLHFHFSETFCVIFIFIWKVDCSGCSRTFIREKQKEIQFCVTHFSKLSRGTGFYTNISFATKGQKRLFDVFTRLHRYNFFFVLRWPQFLELSIKEFPQLMPFMKTGNIFIKQNIIAFNALTKVYWSNSENLKIALSGL